MTITITETAMADVDDLRVGVGGIREKAYTDASGVEKRGPTAILTIADHSGRELFDERVHPGQRVTVGGTTWNIDSVTHAPGALGSVTISKVVTP